MKNQELKWLEIKIIIILLVTVLLLTTGLTIIKYNQYSNVIINQLKEDSINVHKFAEMELDERGFIDLNTIEEQETELYLALHSRLDEIRRIANIRYLYTAKLNEEGILIYVVDGLSKDDELFRNIGDLIEEEIIEPLMLCMADEIVLGNKILDTEWGVVYVAYFPFHDSAGNVIGAIGMEFDTENLNQTIITAILSTILFSIILAVVAMTIMLFFIRKIIKRTDNDLETRTHMLNSAVEQIKRRDELLMAVNQAAAILLTTEEDNEDITSLLLAAMELVGNSLNADRIHIWQYSEAKNDHTVTNRYSWTSKNSMDLLNPIRQGRVISFKNRTDKISQYKMGTYFNNLISELPPAEKAFYTNEDVISVADIPLFFTNQLWGVLYIDACQYEMKLSDEEIKILRSIGLMIVTLINRQEVIEKRTHEISLQAALITTLFDTIPDHIFLKDLNSRFVQCNKSFCDFYGLTKEAIIGKLDFDGLGRSYEFTENFKEVDQYIISSGETIKIEHPIPRADGTVLHMETFKTPLMLNGEAVGVLGIARDITDHKEMESKIATDLELTKKLQSEADTANQTKSLFLARMSHEIRTPMNTILGVAEIMMQSATLTAEASEWLGRIYTSGNILMGIINDVLDFSKIEAGKMEIGTADYQIASVINDTVQLNIMRGEEKNIDFELNINDKIPANLIGDELRIKQILNNLLSNAFKYTESGNIVLSFDYNPMKSDDTLMLVISVRDSGCGMTEEQLNSLFNEYSRFDNESVSEIEGTGLGLSIAKHLIELMDGKIEVKSHPGKGTEFTVRLPQLISSYEELGKTVTESLKNFTFTLDNRRERRKTIREIMPYGSVLIVDDVEANRFVAMGLLKTYKIQVDTAESGYEAIEKIQNGKIYDIIFMDHMMPGIDGMETTQHIREMGYTSPIVALTANVVSSQMDIFLANGFDAFLAKPIDIRMLTFLLNKLIRDKQPPEVLEAARQQVSDTGSHKQEAKNIQSILTAKNQLNTHVRNMTISGIDVTKGLNRYDGDAKVYLMILRSYAAGMRTILDSLSTDNKDDESLARYTMSVHSIKGASYDIYANSIGIQAEALEDAAKNRNIDHINKNTESFLENARSLIDQIDAAIEEIEKLNPKPLKDKPEKELLKKLAIACDTYNIDDVDTIMSEIDLYKYESDDGLAIWLRQNVDMMNFSLVVEKLSDCM
ncbi:MAG: response regulator [Oscillospiraceae bacterium]|jgi:PAS domain S-box-containing protein|nr:response regulator [Oscillospiraceae bacterium]